MKRLINSLFSQLWWKNHKGTKPDFKTLRSNYIFSRIAEHYKAKHETYVKWRMGKAINGILLNFENGAQLEISCFNSEYKQEVDLFENEITVHCDNIYFLIAVFMEEFPGVDKFHCDFPRIKNFISEANSEFNNLDKSIDPYLIRKLQLSINIEANGKANVLKNNICSSISELVNTDRYKSTEARFLDWGENNYTFEVEYYVDGVNESVLVEQLKPYFPDIKSPLTKYGFIGIYHTIQDCREKSLKWTHITGRNF